ncbi:hypothetical protein R3W88_031691 [Solanum pinnatisectum]|uniref:Reverse transcriptase n=1 Tax=Solanum pinnatisectum TaxID=50273 RepID=A0AAV9LM19_9SOLN|nr:hypothetical protein R3W88_031691 [Solanum pinnatisectum]
MERVVDPKLSPHKLAYRNLLTVVFKAFNVPLGEGPNLKPCVLIWLRLMGKVIRLKEQLLQQQLKSNAQVDRVL